MAKAGKSLMDLIEIAAKRHDGASGRRLADLAQRAGHDISHATLNRLRQGTYASRPTDASIRAIAYLAEVPETVAFAAVGVRPPAADQYQVPAEAHRMNTRQRRALDELLKAFVVEQAAPTTPGLGALLAARDDLAAALATAESDPGPLAAAAHAAIAAIDDVAAALFSDAVGLGESHDDAAWVPAGDPTPVVYATGGR
ncbi:hypothetical protein KIH27_20230 [Mycobacterium sp. M1]|uniref:Transcriptional regulator n=1 Tax=Mycolicibacter acidiphilus TaxID=2835306 RepID=A0ABS5RNP0_9MYCO|nr:hypothetical protein [Mycolicibacter acidiphilus]MBS9535915.1 hypothetical protein [Mycolicibacter acidiphilus]